MIGEINNQNNQRILNMKTYEQDNMIATNSDQSNYYDQWTQAW